MVLLRLSRQGAELTGDLKMRTLRYEIPIAPVSTQAGYDSRVTLKSLVQSMISKERFFLSGEVRVNIDWMVHDRVRYETDQAPDVDNIIKPIVDAISGPSGIIFDDCQVQRVNCGWIDSLREAQWFSLEIQYVEEEKISSRDVVFVQFDNGLCFPFAKSIPTSTMNWLVTHIRDRLAMRERIFQSTGSYDAALRIMPIQRFFHRTRIHGFDVVAYTLFIDRTE